MANGKCRGCELKDQDIHSLLEVNKHYKGDAIRYSVECELLQAEVDALRAQLASEKEKDTIARFRSGELIT